MNVELVTRRSLLVGSATAAALVLAWRGGVIALTRKGDIHDWLAIEPTGEVILKVTSVEMGQGAQTGLAQIIADELEADWSRIRVEMAPIGAPFLGPDGDYSTGGSESIKTNFERFRGLGAAGRDMLVRAAAARWGLAPTACRAQNGRVIEAAGGRSLDYGALAGAAAQLAPSASPQLKPRSAWRYIGQPIPRLDLPTKVNGKAVYGIDVDQPGMLVATIAQSPRFGGKLTSVDPATALAVPGVRRVVKLETAVVVVADGYWAAKTGLEALQPVWSPGPLAGVSSADISAKLHALATAGGGKPHLEEGAAAAALAIHQAAMAKGVRRFAQTYEVPLLAHATMEPMNATALVAGGKVTLWVPTQAQSDLRHDVAKALGVGEDKVEIHTTQIGGGFGRRLNTDYGVFAAQTAREVGVPVKLIWSRAEDTQHDFYRPAAVAKLEAALGADGLPLAFRADIACLDNEPFGGISPTPYKLPAAYVTCTTWNPGVPIGAWRSVDWTQNTFFVESFVDELAVLAGQDPVAYRERLLVGNERLLRLLRAAAERAQWGKPAPAGRFRGVALCERDGTPCVEIVELTPGAAGASPRVHKVTAAIDCGTAVNPDQVRAQVEGGVTLALSATLAQEITLRDGKVEQAWFDTYPMVRMAAAPQIDTVILDTPEAKVTGVGEPPVPPLPPALANALAAATGKRVRKLPIVSAKVAAV
ncbi:MAG TPA: molybdopterin cofactor-binding domain-containing protein [Caulobacteraceae bacterium]|nr:molybdopterin cofactor-binding domain-containing protein [Caulobacteraceae bacterium]